MTDTHRFFVAVSDAACDEIRLALDAAWGFPTPDGQTITCFPPAAELPHDASGRPLLAVDAEFCQFDAAAAMLPGLLAAGVVQELTRAEYQAAAVRADSLRP